MDKTSVQKLASVLRVLVLIVFACNVLALYLVPGLSASLGESSGGAMTEAAFYWHAWAGVWSDSYCAVLTVFLWICGICTAIILWQAKRVLGSILKADTFSFANAANMKRAAICCFVVSGAALARLIWRMIYNHSFASIVSYNALFVPIFLIAGLVCMVMAALFRQAAELKAENDLTI